MLAAAANSDLSSSLILEMFLRERSTTVMCKNTHSLLLGLRLGFFGSGRRLNASIQKEAEKGYIQTDSKRYIHTYFEHFCENKSR